MAAAPIPTISELEVVARLALASGLGAVIGFEREWRDRTAGLRTHMLVCLGAAAFTIISAYGFSAWYAAYPVGERPNVMNDPTRIAAQIVSGIGFLGAGAIFRSDDGVRGLTTAASLWVMAAIGMGVGAGDYTLAISATAMILLVLVALRAVTARIREINRGERTPLEVLVSGPSGIGSVFDSIAAAGGSVSDFTVDTPRKSRSTRRLHFELELPPDEEVTGVVGRLAMLDGVESVAVRH